MGRVIEGGRPGRMRMVACVCKYVQQQKPGAIRIQDIQESLEPKGWTLSGQIEAGGERHFEPVILLLFAISVSALGRQIYYLQFPAQPRDLGVLFKAPRHWFPVRRTVRYDASVLFERRSLLPSSKSFSRHRNISLASSPKQAVLKSLAWHFRFLRRGRMAVVYLVVHCTEVYAVPVRAKLALNSIENFFFMLPPIVL